MGRIGFDAAVSLVSMLIEQIAVDEIDQNIVLVDSASTTLVEKAENVSEIASEVGFGSDLLAKSMEHFKV